MSETPRELAERVLGPWSLTEPVALRVIVRRLAREVIRLGDEKTTGTVTLPAGTYTVSLNRPGFPKRDESAYWCTCDRNQGSCPIHESNAT